MPLLCPPIAPQAFTAQREASFVCNVLQVINVLTLQFHQYSVQPAHMLVTPVCSAFLVLKVLTVLLRDCQFIIHVNPVTSLTLLVQSNALCALQATVVLIIQPLPVCALRGLLAQRDLFLVLIVQQDFMLMSQEHQNVFLVLGGTSVVTLHLPHQDAPLEVTATINQYPASYVLLDLNVPTQSSIPLAVMLVRFL